MLWKSRETTIIRVSQFSVLHIRTTIGDRQVTAVRRDWNVYNKATDVPTMTRYVTCLSYLQDRQCTHDVTFRRVHKTIVPKDKQSVLHISVCACTWVRACDRGSAWSLTYPARNAQAPYCHLWRLWIHSILEHYLMDDTIFGKRLLSIKCVFSFSL
jgi:hypothetical protein